MYRRKGDILMPHFYDRMFEEIDAELNADRN